MKKLYILSILLVASISFSQVSDRFTGTGALNANGWTTHSGLIPGQLTISTGSLTYSSIIPAGNKVALVSGNTEDVNLSCGTAITGTVYYSVIINLPNTNGLNQNTATGDYSISLGGASGAIVTSLPGRIYFRAGAIADTFNLGVLNNSGGTVTPSYVATNFPINIPVFAVVKYDISTNAVSLFINPALNSTEPTASAANNTGTTTAPASIASIAIRQSTGTGNVEFDDVRIADNWAYVSSSSLKINQNSIAGLKVYPNPVSNGTLFIESDLNSDKNVTIFDVLGKQVLNTTTSNNAINVSQLHTGIYMVRITEEGNTATKKLVIR
jgi:hypothetical protein